MEKLFTIETHLHTAQGSACAVSTGEEMARAHKAAGYDAIILTRSLLRREYGRAAGPALGGADRALLRRV